MGGVGGVMVGCVAREGQQGEAPVVAKDMNGMDDRSKWQEE